MDYRSSSDLSGFNTIVHGHRMRNGTMFVSLKYYDQKSCREAHPHICIVNSAGTYVYEIFSAASRTMGRSRHFWISARASL